MHSTFHPAEEEHWSLILDQFTQQAAPLAAAPAHSNEDALQALISAVAVEADDTVLDWILYRPPVEFVGSAASDGARLFSR